MDIIRWTLGVIRDPRPEEVGAICNPTPLFDYSLDSMPLDC